MLIGDRQLEAIRAAQAAIIAAERKLQRLGAGVLYRPVSEDVLAEQMFGFVEMEGGFRGGRGRAVLPQEG